MLTARAFENTCGIVAFQSIGGCIQANAHTQAIVFANAGGPPGRGYAGLSQVTVPFAGALSKLGGCGEGMAVVDVDMVS
jgi:predicted amidohydrolase